MFHATNARFFRSARRRPATKARPAVDALEVRDMPAALPWISAGTQPIPPTKTASTSLLLPSLKPIGHENPPWRPFGHIDPTFKPVGVISPELKPFG